MIEIFVESEDTYRQLITTDFDTTPYAIEYSFVKSDASSTIPWTLGTWEGDSEHTDLSVWQRWSATPNIGPDGSGDVALSVGDWSCYARIDEKVFYVDLIVVKAAGVPA